jgi:hypothetical protein
MKGRRPRGQGAADSERAKEANKRADNYMLAVVFFASSLFCTGISIKLHSERAKKVLLGSVASSFWERWPG